MGFCEKQRINRDQGNDFCTVTAIMMKTPHYKTSHTKHIFSTSNVLFHACCKDKYILPTKFLKDTHYHSFISPVSSTVKDYIPLYWYWKSLPRTQPVSCGMWKNFWSPCDLSMSATWNHINHNTAVQKEEVCHGHTHPECDLQNVEGWRLYSLSSRET